MRPSETAAFVKFCLEHNYPMMLAGPPGVGKTSVVLDAAQEMGMDCILSHPVVADPTDFRGMPAVVNGEAKFLPFSNLKVLVTTKKPVVFFMDDFGQAPASVQAAAMQLLLARELDGIKISSTVRFIVATNRVQDKAGVRSVLEPVKSRFYSIVELMPNVDDWVGWAFKNNMPEILVSYVRNAGSVETTGDDGEKGPATHIFGAYKPTRDMTNSPNPRTVAFLGEMVNKGVMALPNHQEIVAGAIGKAFAADFLAYYRCINDLPNIEQILVAPDTVPPVKKPAVAYITMCMLVKRVDGDSIDEAFTWIEGLGRPEYTSCFVNDLLTYKEDIVINSPKFRQWASDNADVITKVAALRN